MNVTIYENGEKFIQENEELLKEQIDANTFFFLDAPLLKNQNKENYGISINQGSKKIVCLKVEPFNMMFYGEKSLIGDLIDCLYLNDFHFKSYLCIEELGNHFASLIKERHNLDYEEALAMDFLKCAKKHQAYDNAVEKAEEKDIPRILEGLKQFIIDCHLEDSITEEQVKRRLSSYRVIRENGEIASFALSVMDSNNKSRLSNVFTFQEYRGKGYAKKIVSNILNEIIDSGRIACLNVDQNNPISYHLYKSLGFEKEFSQGEYRLKK